MDLADAVPGLDVVFAGHTHESYYVPVVHSNTRVTHVIQCDWGGQHLAQVKLSLGTDGNVFLTEKPQCLPVNRV